MQERRENEQYFFSKRTAIAAADVVARFERPCVLCAPTVGRELVNRGVDVTILDIDERFADLPGFQLWDIRQPRRLDGRFGVIFCDPPFFNVSLGLLQRAIGVLAHHDGAQRIAISYLTRRRRSLLASFTRFQLTATPMQLEYETLEVCSRNRIELFANFDVPGTQS